ncbi:MAG: putative sugar nucleotidyl transferase, partial [bacterium]
MSLKVFIFEDEAYRQFYPLTHLRPVYALRSGILPLYKRIPKFFAGVEVSLICREEIAPMMAEQEPDCPVNILKRAQGHVLLLNGRLRHPGDLPAQLSKARIGTVFTVGHDIAAVYLDEHLLSDIPSLATPEHYARLLADETTELTTHETTARLYNYCWELMADIEPEIEADFEFLKPSVVGPDGADRYRGVIIIDPQKVHVGDRCDLRPGAVLDASGGSIYIGDNCRVESQAAIYGPCYIGHDSVVVAGKLTGCSVGHTCRVGGEVEESVFQSCVNK